MFCTHLVSASISVRASGRPDGFLLICPSGYVQLQRFIPTDGPDMLVVLLANGHTDAEKTMRAAGHIQELLGGRHLLRATDA